MKRGMLALGIFLLLVGVVFLGGSRIVIQPELGEKWVGVEETRSGPTQSLSIEGNLTQNDTFVVRFDFRFTSTPVQPMGRVQINVTDPVGDTFSYDVVVEARGGKPVIPEFPEGIANLTGRYGVHACASVEKNVQLSSLGLWKMEIKNTSPQYPYGFLFPLGIIVSICGVVVCFFGARRWKCRRTRLVR